MTDEQYLDEISKHLQAMSEAVDHTPQHQAAKLLAQSYLILYNAQPSMQVHLSLDQINHQYVAQDNQQI